LHAERTTTGRAQDIVGAIAREMNGVL
jgi:hypothetical protein